MKIRVYIDEDSMCRALIVALRARGVDVESALEANMISRADDDHLEYATAQGRALYSFNVADFCSPHKRWGMSGKQHAGIILAQQRQFSTGEQMRRLLRLISTRSAEDLSNQVEFLSRGDL